MTHPRIKFPILSGFLLGVMASCLVAIVVNAYRLIDSIVARVIQ